MQHRAAGHHRPQVRQRARRRGQQALQYRRYGHQRPGTFGRQHVEHGLGIEAAHEDDRAAEHQRAAPYQSSARPWNSGGAMSIGSPPHGGTVVSIETNGSTSAAAEVRPWARR
ncbi:hypothetical protein [Nonomuraea jiangxiensis]|uniref:hypothetical protein n=1 Tax=Nonomuraea jiangxiensis TaxID=633440 RepID=UPI000B86ABFE|nr:hypothetical protein [Nonomuraea jiangxiensis]